MEKDTKKRFERLHQSITSNVEGDFSGTFSNDPEECDLQIKNTLELSSRSTAIRIVCSEDELDDLAVSS